MKKSLDSLADNKNIKYYAELNCKCNDKPIFFFG